MKYKTFLFFLLGIGIFLFIGVMTMLGLMNSDSYIRAQEYNNLPSMNTPVVQEPTPIQHYKDAVDDSNKAEVSNAAPINYTTSLGNESIYPFPDFQIGRVHISSFSFLVVFITLHFVLYSFNILDFMGIRTRNHIFLSMMIAFAIALGFYYFKL